MRIIILTILLSAANAEAETIFKCGSVWQSHACGQPRAKVSENSPNLLIERQQQQIARLSNRAAGILGEVPASVDHARIICSQGDSPKLCQVMVLKAETLINQLIERHNRQRLATLKLQLEQQKLSQRDRKLKLDEQKIKIPRRITRRRQ